MSRPARPPKNPSLNNCRASTYTSQTHLAKLLFRPERRKKRTTENQKKRMKLCDAHCIKSQVSIVKILGANKNSNRCNFSCVEFSYFVDLIGQEKYVRFCFGALLEQKQSNKWIKINCQVAFPISSSQFSNFHTIVLRKFHKHKDTWKKIILLQKGFRTIVIIRRLQNQLKCCRVILCQPCVFAMSHRLKRLLRGLPTYAGSGGQVDRYRGHSQTTLTRRGWQGGSRNVNDAQINPSQMSTRGRQVVKKEQNLVNVVKECSRI